MIFYGVLYKIIKMVKNNLLKLLLKNSLIRLFYHKDLKLLIILFKNWNKMKIYLLILNY